MSNIQKNFGRPKDIKKEIQFMEKLRDNKLQLQLCLVSTDYNEPSEGSSKKRLRAKSAEERAPELININQLFTLNLNNLDQHEMEKLSVQFQEIIKTWQFLDIGEDEQLPQFLFESEADLSFILQELKKKYGYKKFKASELLFIELMIIEYNKMMTSSIFQYFTENISYMLRGVEEGLKKMLQKQEEQLKKKEKDEIQKLKQNQSYDGFLEESELETPKKTKTIGKKKRGRKSLLLPKKPQKKKKKLPEYDEDESIDIQEEIIYPEGKKLALITCNYIAWAYWYVFDK